MSEGLNLPELKETAMPKTEEEVLDAIAGILYCSTTCRTRPQIHSATFEMRDDATKYMHESDWGERPAAVFALLHAYRSARRFIALLEEHIPGIDTVGEAEILNR